MMNINWFLFLSLGMKIIKILSTGIIIMIIRFFKKTIFLCLAVFLFAQSVLGHNVEDSIAIAQKGALGQTGQSITYERTYDLLYTCPLDSNKQIEVILKESPPTKDNVVIDIGSGLGRGSRHLALLGYTVYSIDAAPGRQQIQEDLFCDFPSCTNCLFMLIQDLSQKLIQGHFSNIIDSCKNDIGESHQKPRRFIGINKALAEILNNLSL